MATINVTNSTLDPQLAAILNTKADADLLTPSSYCSTEDQLNNTWGHLRVSDSGIQ